MIYFLIPVFNEADNLALLAENILNCLPGENKYFIFVDDCSTDDTVAVLNKHFAGQQLQVITKLVNAGPGDSFNLGFDWILAHSTSEDDRIVTMEGDNTSDIKILYNMVSISRLGYNLVLASVYAQGGGFDKTSFFRKLSSMVANLLIRFVFDIKILTLSSFYRVYTPELLRKIKAANPAIIEEKGFISMVEVLVKAIHEKARIIEVPMVLDSSIRKGKSKMKIVSNMFRYIHFLIKSK
jgi:glycosyltransferase involved in cell wall biosynthesis